MKNAQDIVNKYYLQMFDELVDNLDDDLEELLIEVKVSSTGETIRRSWADREKMLAGRI